MAANKKSALSAALAGGEAAAPLDAGRLRLDPKAFPCLAGLEGSGAVPALVAGAVLAWARALGEFGATITFAGNFPGTTQTMPLATYLALETDPQEALVISIVLIAVSFAVLVGLRDRWLHGARAGFA